MNDTVNEDTVKPVVIVGMGSGGLAAAIKLVQNGQKVAIFENRDYFTRPQRIYIRGKSQDFIDSLIDPDDPLDEKYQNNKTSVDDNSVRVRSVQKFLYRKLLALQKEHPELVTVHHGKHFNITGIDADKQVVHYEEHNQKKEAEFSHFIEADGTRHLMADLLNTSAQINGKQPYFNFELQEVQHRHSPCGVIQLKLNLPEGLESSKKDLKECFELLIGEIDWAKEDCENLIKQGWDKPYYPMQLIYADSAQSKLSIASEIPEELLKLYQNKETKAEFQTKYIEWARFFILTKIQKLIADPQTPENVKIILNSFKAENLLIQPKNLKEGRSEEYVNQIRALNTTAFPLEYFGADKPTTILGNGGIYALIGDSFQSPWFFGSHGMNDAIAGGIELAEALSPENSFDLATFNAGMNQRRKNETKMIRDELSQSQIKIERIQSEFNVFKASAEALFTTINGKNKIPLESAQIIKELIKGLNHDIKNLSNMTELTEMENKVQQLSKALLQYKSALFKPEKLTASFQNSKNIENLNQFKHIKQFANNFHNQIQIVLETNFPQKYSATQPKIDVATRRN